MSLLSVAKLSIYIGNTKQSVVFLILPPPLKNVKKSKGHLPITDKWPPILETRMVCKCLT